LKFLKQLTKPHYSITDEISKRKSRLLSFILIGLQLISMPFGILYFLHTNLHIEQNIFAVILLLIIVYFINKIGKYRLSIFILVLSFPAVQLADLLLNISFNPASTISFLVVGIVLSGIFMDFTDIIIVSSVYTAAIILIGFTARSAIPDFKIIISPLMINVVVAIFIILHSIHNRGIMKYQHEKLAESEERYRTLFEESPAALWEYDASKLKSYIDKLKKHGVADFKEYFDTHPDELLKCNELMLVTAANKRLVELYNTGNVDNFIKDHDKIFKDKNIDRFKEQLLALLSGSTALQGENTHYTMDGREIKVFTQLAIPPRCRDNWAKFLISVIDITQLKIMEEKLKKRAHFLELVSNVGRLINRELNTDELLLTTVSSISEILGYYNNSIWFVHGNSLILKAYSFSSIENAQGKLAKITGQKLPKEGIIGWAVNDNEVKYVPDVTTNSHFVKHGVELRTKSECAIPLKGKDRIIGALDIQSDSVNAFTQEDIYILTTVADQISAALQNAELFGDAQKRAERLSAVNRMAEAVNSTLEVDELLKRTYETIKELFTFDAFYIALYHEKSKTVDYRISIDRGSYLKPYVKPLEEALVSTVLVIQTGSPLNLDNVQKYREEHLDTEHWGIDEPPDTILAVPLRISEGVTGIISIQSYRGIHYSSEDMEFLATLADQTAIALENARLFKNLQSELIRRKNLEDQLVQAQKMEAIGRLAGGIAHDFNNLLTAIIGYTDLLLTEVSNDYFKDELNEIKKASKRAALLTSQLLAFGRKQFLSMEILDINLVIKDMENMLKRLIREDIDLHILLSKEPCPVETDPGQLSQVIMNLIVNAKDAMPKGGKLTIETSNVELGEDYMKDHFHIKPGLYSMIAVSDTGSGMDAETIKHIFEPFFTTKGIGEGTGLGLSMVYGIIKQTGGEIMVYSEPGYGTTFKIYLPKAVQDRAFTERGKTNSKQERQGSETILLVEDEPVVCKVTARVLKNAGYTVLRAGTADEAREIYKKKYKQVDLLITDVIMPGDLSGSDLAGRLLEKDPGLKVLYISGYTENTIVHHGVLNPGIYFLQKPFTPEALLEQVHKIIKNS